MLKNLNQNHFFEIFDKNGFYLVEDCLVEDDLNLLNKYFLINKQKEDKNTKLKFNIKSNLNDLINFDLENIKKKIILKKILKKYDLINTAKLILNSKISEYSADYYLSLVNKNKMVIPWHTDQAYSGAINVTNFVDPNKAAIKFFFYLTDVDSENGCLGYIPGSHKISYFLKKLIAEKKISYSPYWKLDDYRKLVGTDKIRKELLKYVSQKDLDDFITNTQFIEKNSKDTKSYDIPTKAGSLLIFDESGVHRGGAVQKFDRKCIRFFFRR